MGVAVKVTPTPLQIVLLGLTAIETRAGEFTPLIIVIVFEDIVGVAHIAE